MLVFDKNAQVLEYLHSLELGNIEFKLCELNDYGPDHRLVVFNSSDREKVQFHKDYIYICYSDDNSEVYFNDHIKLGLSSNKKLSRSERALLTSLCLLEGELLEFNHNLITLNQNFEKAQKKMTEELKRVKRIYLSHTYRRFENIKGVSFFSKFVAGRSNGGEFFDAQKIGNKVIFFMSHTNSYLYSSIILELFDSIKNLREVNEEILKHKVLSLYDSLGVETLGDEENQILIGMMNLSTLEVKSYSLGSFQVYLDDRPKNWLPEMRNVTRDQILHSYIEFKIHRNQRMLITSPGFQTSWQDFGEKKNISDFLDVNIECQDILDEYFFVLRKNKNDDFLNVDSSAVYLEVDENVMLEI